MRTSNGISSLKNYCQNPCSTSRCYARQYLMCPHCSYHLCFEHAHEHQKHIQNQTMILLDQAENIRNQLNQYEPVQIIIEQVFKSFNEWKEKMFDFINEYSQQIQMHIQHAQYRLNQQWNLIRKEYFRMLNHLAIQPINQLLQAPERIHPLEVREIENNLIDIENQMINLLNNRDLLRINFDSCSLTGDIRISRGDFPLPKIQTSKYSNEQSSIGDDENNNNNIDLNEMNLVYQLKTFSNETSALGVSSYRRVNSSEIFVTWDKPSTLILFDFDQYLIKRIHIEPSFDYLNDIIWCDYFNQFLLAGSAFYTFNCLNNQIQQIFISENPQIWSITAHKTNLYILYIMGEYPLIEHRSLPSFNLIESFSRLQILPTDNSSIIDIGRTIRTNDYCLAMTVRNLHTCQWRIDLFNFHMQRIIQGQIFGYAAHPDYWCCSLTCYRSFNWLIINNTSQPETLTLINRHGNIQQQIPKQGFNIVTLQDNQHFVIKDQNGLNIFQI